MSAGRLRPEILAPAGDPLSLRAAIAAGADAEDAEGSSSGASPGGTPR